MALSEKLLAYVFTKLAILKITISFKSGLSVYLTETLGKLQREKNKNN